MLPRINPNDLIEWFILGEIGAIILAPLLKHPFMILGF
jgi:hypothetical protein